MNRTQKSGGVGRWREEVAGMVQLWTTAVE